ncbi:hypothetical protein F4818DRAFT_438068 [Hypoxylon cercidicola]|nr:hypothetical protein F4818DRAFT_438068 [Hypoxylon cercidicola]
MGNSLSAEAPWRGQRTTQKLSKPKTSNPTAAGLLNPNGASNPARSSPAARRMSLPDAPSPAPLPNLPETDHAMTAGELGGKRETESGSRLSRMLFRSNTSKEVPRYRQRSSSSIGVPGSQQEHWSSRANSFRIGSEEVLHHVPHGTLSVNGSRTSFNYDIGSYEAQRLLNLVEVPSHESNSAISENRAHISEAMRDDSKGRRPSIPDTNASMTRENSEVSLYTPMRRRSLMMTPGVATRDVRPDPSSSRGRTRYSLPSTPSRRESLESMNVGTISFPPLLTHPDPIPRALTPCEAEYKQTGAFKLGTLRITNGSPARSPARDPNDAIPKSTEKSSANGLKYYSGTVREVPNSSTEVEPSGTAAEAVGSQNTGNQLRVSRHPGPDAVLLEPASQPQTSSQLLPNQQLNQPLVDDGKLKTPQIQVTSKHTAVEDELFDDDQNEYSSVEVLDVRVDTNAKSLPPRPKLMTERRSSKDISRSDSGIASPASECSQPPLSKADSGYSSSVSLRSLSSKPAVPEKDRSSDIEVEVMPNASAHQSIGSRESDISVSPTTVASVRGSDPFQGASPPPVPTKDFHLMTLAGSKASGELSPSIQQHSSWPGPSNVDQMPQRVLSPSNNIRSQTNSFLESQRASLLNPTAVQSDNSTLSISTGFRKPGRLQRFLSGGRTSLIVHSTHPTEYSSVPAVSRDMHVKLQSHSGRLPTSFRRFALKSAASKETLGTILSVGSAELLQDDDVPLSNPSGQSRGPDQKGTPISIESAIVNISSPTLAKKAIPRKPVPIRSKESSARKPTKPQRITDKISRDDIQAASWHGTNDAGADSTRSVGWNERIRHSVPAVKLTRSNSMTGHVKVDGESTYASFGRSYDMGQGKSHSTTSLELPTAGPNVRLSKSPPPVSMRTRNMGSLRMPPPPRSRSTPPENFKRSGRPAFSRSGSRDGNLTIPEVAGTFVPNHPVASRRSSRENFHSVPPTQPYRYANTPPTSAANNFQPTGSRTQAATLSRRPSWDVQVNHGPSLSRRPSSENYSRRSSLASQHSQRNSATTGPNFSQPQYGSHPNLTSLQRRSSYEDYSLTQLDSGIRDNGPYPSMSRNGQPYVTDPWSGRSMSMPQQADEPLDQPTRHPSHAPRHHYRHRSLDQNGTPAPYRVLHSYHSPAYKNVPIWG